MKPKLPISVGCEWHFYDLPSVTHDDLQLINRYILAQPNPNIRVGYRRTLERLIRDIFIFKTHRDEFEQKDEMEARAKVWKTNTIENAHALIKQNFLPILDCMKSQDLSFYWDPVIPRCVDRDSWSLPDARLI